MSISIKGVILDLDGTLIDSMGIWYRIDRIFLRENGVTDPPEDISDRMKKMTVEESSVYFREHFGLSCTAEYISRRIEELVRVEYEQNIALTPGVYELLGLLDRLGIPYGVATATYRSLAEAILSRYDILSRLRFLLTDREFPSGKKTPDIFLGAAEILEIVPCETLVIEDSLHCIRAAAEGGFLTAAVYDSAAERETEQIRSEADWYFGSLGEVCGFIDKAV